MSIRRLGLEAPQPCNMTVPSRRRGMANVLEGLTEYQRLSLHQRFRRHSPPSPSPLDVASDAEDDQEDVTMELPSRYQTRRNAVCYNEHTEQLVREIVRDVHTAGYMQEHRRQNGFVQH